MNTATVSYKRHRFPPQIIAHAVWLYYRFPLSLRLVEEMLLERGIVVSYDVVLLEQYAYLCYGIPSVETKEAKSFL